jgi:ABC-type spermidine/putrescine transport system permease subunit II
VLVALFLGLPIVLALGTSLMRISLTRSADMPFTGVRNYALLAGDSELLVSLPLTIGFALFTTMPAARPGIAAAAILMLIGTWNEFLFAVVLGNHDAVTVTRLIGLVNTTTGPMGRPPYTLVAAAGVVAPCVNATTIDFMRDGWSSAIVNPEVRSAGRPA